MSANDDFTADHPLPLFLSGHADRYEQPRSSPILRASVLVITATVIGGATTLLLGNPLQLLADVTASPTEISALQPGTDQPPPTIQSPADGQPSPPTASGLPTREEIAATSDAADQSQKETGEAPSLALLKQFQAWAAEQDARAQVEPGRPAQDARAQVEPERPAQDAQAQALQNARASLRHRRVRPAQNLRAENRQPRDLRARVRPDQHARAQLRPVQDARAQDQAEQNPQAPSFLQGLGLWRQ